MRAVAVSWSLLLGAALALSTPGCAYPRRSTSVSTVRDGTRAGTMGAPADLWQLTIVEGHIAPRKAGDLAWDDGEGLPDVMVRVVRGGATLFETPAIEDSLNPRWDAILPRNIQLPPHARLRFEVWDSDAVGSDPVGQYESRGMPADAVPGADTRVLLERGSWLTIRFEQPVPHRGVGLARYEIRPDSLIVLEVLPYSPAERAGLQPGDAIVQIGDRRISEMNDGQAATELSMSGRRRSELTIRGGGGAERAVTLDQGLIWLMM